MNPRGDCNEPPRWEAITIPNPYPSVGSTSGWQQERWMRSVHIGELLEFYGALDAPHRPLYVARGNHEYAARVPETPARPTIAPEAHVSNHRLS